LPLEFHCWGEDALLGVWGERAMEKWWPEQEAEEKGAHPIFLLQSSSLPLELLRGSTP